jgi:HAD superfamily hydrolase (TIGR01662 family)
MTSVVLFDWDGTLVDSRAALLRAWHVATEAALGRRFPADEHEEELVFTRPGKELFAQLAGDAGPGALVDAFQAEYARSSAGVRAYDGVPEMLRTLRAQGILIGVVTSKARTRFATDARRAAIAELVDHAVCVEDTTAHKPDPAPVLHALTHFGVSAARAVMVGDTPVDIAAGLRAGTAVVGVGWGASGSDPLIAAGASAVARDAHELIGLVGERGEARVTA